jgi:acyl carrier protein
MPSSWTDVRTWILERNPELSDLDQDTDIIDSRIVNSLQFVELVLFVEELRGTMIQSDEVDFDAFRTLRSIDKNFLGQ